MKDSDEKEGAFRKKPVPVSKPSFLPSFGMFFLFIAVSFLIYLPVIDHFFVSDDFKVLYRVCVEQTILIKHFFRPLSDLSILMNYQLGGLNPLVFNSFNIGIHGINAYLVYRTSLSFGRRFEKNERTGFALISAALFLTYPFHNEAVVWILGRGASMACLFSLLSILCYYSNKNENSKIAGACCFYFISLSAFESVIFLPFCYICLLIFEKENPRPVRKWAGFLMLTLCIHILLRYWMAGSLLGSYGQDFFHSGLKTYVLNIAKVGGRLLLPPSGSALLMTAVFIALISFGSFLIYKNKNKILHTDQGKAILCLSGLLLIACIIPVITGVSTQTSETDRVLYFPSVFLCMTGGLLIVSGIKNPSFRSWTISLLLVYNIFFLEINNMNWKKASTITFTILEKISAEKRMRDTGHLYFLNIPNEVNGAYVFRLGFRDALNLYGFDSSRNIAVNYLPRHDLEKMKSKTTLYTQNTEMELPPDIILKQHDTGCREIIDHGLLKFTCVPGDHIFFWNMEDLEEIQACPAGNPN